MGTLYIVGISAHWEAVTLRARRILGRATGIVAQDADQARRLLAQSGSTAPIIPPTDHSAVLRALQGGDVALILDEGTLGSSGAAQQLVRRAAESQVPIAAVPGPSRPITALIRSGLPTDAFVQLGVLPSDPSSRRDLLTAIAGEPRTLLVQGPPPALDQALTDLLDALGDRPLAILDAGDALWRGTISQAQGQSPIAPWILVIGGRRATSRWAEARLRAEIAAHLDRGLGIKEISKQLAAPSGWPRRRIYRLAVEMQGRDHAR